MNAALNPVPQDALPKTQEDALNWLRLIRARQVGPATFLRLLFEYGSAQRALSALPDLATEAGMDTYQITSIETIRQEIRAGNALGARLLFIGTDHYPTQLYDLDDPPPALWAIGDTALLKKPAIALVGGRNASAAGKRMATKLASELGDMGYAVVSGLKHGISETALEAGLAYGTIAVQSGGLDHPSASTSEALFDAVTQKGLRLSEMPMGLVPQAGHNAMSNRLISGLSKAVVVVEADTKSNSVACARNALDQGREVLAIPGSPLDARAAGGNLLIREGAQLVRSAEDIHEAIEILHAPPAPEPEPVAIAPRAPDEPIMPQHILDLLKPAPVSEDELIRKLDAPAAEIMSILTELDLAGNIRRQPGGLVARAS